MPEQKTAEMQKGGPAEVSSFGLDNDPVVQQAAIADLATDGTETVDTISTKVNAILADLRQFGFIAT